MKRAAAVLVCALLASPSPSAAEAEAPAAPATPRATPADVAALLAKTDAAWTRRDAPGALDEVRAALAQAARLAPDDYDVLWRLARLQFWIADDRTLGDKETSRAGKLCWEYGDRATRAAPDRVEGWNYAAAGVGLYALGIGTFRALREGIEGKFKERLSRAEKIDAGFSGGAIQTAWGRFWFKLPWPKYDAKKAERAFRDALGRNPDNVRAHVYLAELYEKEGARDRARAELEAAVANPPGRYDPPEERRMQAVARERLAKR